jgi:phage baseplate assembly protein W
MLENGRYVPDDYLRLRQVSGSDELLQRVLMKLKAPRGAFHPLPDYGSRLYSLFAVKAGKRHSAARDFVQEALSDEKGLELESLELSYPDRDDMRITAVFSYDNGKMLFVETGIEVGYGN